MAENEIKTYTCPNCGAQITNTRNCEYCGSLLVRFAVHGIDVTKTEYMNDDYVFPGLKEELEKNLKLQKEHPGKPVATDIFKEFSDGTMVCMCILNSDNTVWSDNTPVDLESSESGLRIALDFCKSNESSIACKEFNDRQDSELSKFKKLDSFPLFTSHYCQNFIDDFGKESYGYQYAIDFGEDAEGAARLVSEILTRVEGVSVEENVDMFTNVGKDIDTARNNWRKNHGFQTSTTQNSGCMVAATALLVPAVYTVVKLLGTIL